MIFLKSHICLPGFFIASIFES